MERKQPLYNKIEEAIIVALFLCMVAITSFTVVSRYVFNFTFSWAEQLTRVMFVWITFAGISLAGLKGAHMRVSAITFVLPGKLKSWIFYLGDVIAIAFGVFIAGKMYTVMMTTIQNKQVFTAMPSLPVWVMYLAGVIGMLGFSLRVTQGMLIAIKKERNENQQDKGQEVEPS